MAGYKDQMMASFRFHAFNKQAFPVSLEFINNKALYTVKQTFYNDMP